MSESARSLEAGSNFLAQKKARQARTGHRGHVSESARSLEAGSNSLAQKKAVGECHSPTAFLFSFLRRLL
ncbi:MAG: hypothetical protein FWF77_03515 [Defluviitaleaceae bacterium]|nr:hypothetical protein [Defluviitaleaceae bacterium]